MFFPYFMLQNFYGIFFQSIIIMSPIVTCIILVLIVIAFYMYVNEPQRFTVIEDPSPYLVDNTPILGTFDHTPQFDGMEVTY